MRFLEPSSTTDDAVYLELIERVIRALVREDSPQEIWVVRIDNWFGKKWCAFVGKTLGAFGVRRTDRLVLPPFVPTRVEKVRYFHAVVGGYRSGPSPSELHLEQPSESNARRFIDALSDDGLFVWYAARSAKNRRGSIMAYRVRPDGQTAWHAELRERAGRWRPSSLVGVSHEQVAGWIGCTTRSLRGRHDAEYPPVASAELHAILSAFKKKKSKSLRACTWTAEHTLVDGERLDLDFVHLRASIRLSFWPDGNMWVRACRRSDGRRAGWAFHWAFHGRWSNVEPARLVELYQAATCHLEPTAEAAFVAAWSDVCPTVDWQHHPQEE